MTDDVLANPYDTLPPPDYWAAELATTAGSARDFDGPAQPRGLDTVEVYGTRVDLDWEGSHDSPVSDATISSMTVASSQVSRS